MPVLQCTKHNALCTVFPNPFSNTTTISYTLPEESIVKISIYDVLGQKITTLIDKTQNPGQYNIKFDGAALMQGIYFCRFEANNCFAVMKLVISK